MPNGTTYLRSGAGLRGTPIPDYESADLLVRPPVDSNGETVVEIEISRNKDFIQEFEEMIGDLFITSYKDEQLGKFKLFLDDASDEEIQKLKDLFDRVYKAGRDYEIERQERREHPDYYYSFPVSIWGNPQENEVGGYNESARRGYNGEVRNDEPVMTIRDDTERPQWEEDEVCEISQANIDDIFSAIRS